MKTSEILINAKAFLPNAENWYKGTFYSTHGLDESLSDSVNPTCMCGMGAAIQGNKVYLRESHSETYSGWQLSHKYYNLLTWVNQKVYEITNGNSRTFYEFNDDRATTYKMVIEMLDKLIEAAKAEGD
jgi:hypothetical protein